MWDVAVKLLEEADDPDRACQKLQHELELYQCPLHPLQGVSVPRLMASGTTAGPTGNRQPFFALELLPVSLADVEARIGASEFECVLEALNNIHQQGVLHGDTEPRHVVYSSLQTLAQEKEKKRNNYAFWRQINEKPSIIPGCPEPWHNPRIDFCNARQAKSREEIADEVEQCHDSLQLHRARSRPNRLHRTGITQGFRPATARLLCRSCVLSSKYFLTERHNDMAPLRWQR